ncbi:MAG: hypothetical protein J7M25_16260 [Deltaproteobacteria bacterium]|nr:hypothetical protein [Deltaproteobacteria bacterium]
MAGQAVLFVWVVVVVSLLEPFLSGCRWLDRGDSHLDAGGYLPHEDLYDRAKAAARQGNMEDAMDLAFKGIAKWRAREGLRGDRTRRYVAFVHALLPRGGVQPLLDYCVEASSKQSGLCDAIMAAHFRIGLRNRSLRPSALVLFQMACLSELAGRFESACSQVPMELVADRSLLGSAERYVIRVCTDSVQRRDETDFCRTLAVLVWTVVVHHWDLKGLERLTPVVFHLSPDDALALSIRTLVQGGPIPDEVRSLFEKNVVESTVHTDGLKRLIALFSSRIQPIERRLWGRYAARRLKHSVPTVAAILDQLDRADVLRLLSLVDRAADDSVRSMTAAVRSALNHSLGQTVVEAYLARADWNTTTENRVVSYFRTHRSLYERLVCARLASMPLPLRDKYLAIVRRVEAGGGFGVLEGRVVRVDPAMLRGGCLIRLKESVGCDASPAPWPSPRRRHRYQARCGVDGSFVVRHVLAGPYDVSVLCTDRPKWIPVKAFSYDPVSRRFGGIRCAALVVPGRVTEIQSILLDSRLILGRRWPVVVGVLPRSAPIQPRGTSRPKPKARRLTSSKIPNHQ